MWQELRERGRSCRALKVTIPGLRLFHRKRAWRALGQNDVADLGYHRICLAALRVR